MSGIASGLAASRQAEFRVGSALGRAVEVYGAAFDKFFVLTLVPMIPLLIVGLIAGPGKGSPGLQGLSLFLALVLSSLATATCLYGAYRVMQGQSFGVGDSLRAGLDRLASVVGTAFLGNAGIALATLLLIIPGIMVACAIYVALPACVIERLGATDSLRRSQALTRGHRWPIFGLVALVTVIVALLGAGAGAAAGATGSWVLLKVVAFAVQTVAQSFGAVLIAVVYHDLRVAKEGVDIDMIASVFD